jgi:hypothetical protein
MIYIDTPAGKFQIFINGNPADFDAQPLKSYAYFNESDSPAPILACYQISLGISDLSVGDIIDAKFEYGSLQYDGGGEAMDNAVGYVGDHAVGIGATDTQYLEWDANQRQLPYENYGLSGSGFTFHIVDEPQKYTTYPIQKKITFIIAWESTSKEYAWDIVSFMTS